MNIRALDRSIAASRRRTFWLPILTRWMIWFGASWAVGSVLIFAPLIAKLIKELAK